MKFVIVKGQAIQRILDGTLDIINLGVQRIHGGPVVLVDEHYMALGTARVLHAGPAADFTVPGSTGPWVWQLDHARRFEFAIDVRESAPTDKAVFELPDDHDLVEAVALESRKP